MDAFNTWHVGDIQEDSARAISSDFAADIFSSFWIGVLGAPAEIYHDQGSEYGGRFAILCEMAGILDSPLPMSAKWRTGFAERHGAIIKFMLMKIFFELRLHLHWEVRYAAHMCSQAKNRLLRSVGVAPIQELLGFDPRHRLLGDGSDPQRRDQRRRKRAADARRVSAPEGPDTGRSTQRVCLVGRQREASDPPEHTPHGSAHGPPSSWLPNLVL